MNSRPRICVVGSSNIDMNAYVTRFPEPGETVHGLRFTTGFGGKGANQAVMAARLGGDVHFIGRVGDDVFGRDMLDNLRREEINCTHVGISTGLASGVAVISIDDAGRNHIVVIPGANGEVRPADVEATRTVIESSHILVCQMEVPLEANLAALAIAEMAGVPVLFNPAPAPANLPDEVYRRSTVLCLNESELARLMGSPFEESGLQILRDRGVESVVLTLGARGCRVVDAAGSTEIPATTVTAVDTTGAGDAFIGAMAFELASGRNLRQAAERACRIAAITVQSAGTQASFPKASDLNG